MKSLRLIPAAALWAMISTETAFACDFVLINAGERSFEVTVRWFGNPPFVIQTQLPPKGRYPFSKNISCNAGFRVEFRSGQYQDYDDIYAKKPIYPNKRWEIRFPEP